MSLVEVLKIIVLGIVEGFTEWLPISSTGHMILVDEIIRLNQPDAFKDVFLVVIQLGAILAVVVMYFHKLNPFSPTKTSRQKDATWALWIKIIIACVPAAILGLLLDDWMEAHLFNAYVVAAALIVYGVLFIVLENSSVCTNPRFNKVGQISAKTAFLIGMVQLLALIPGTSRSGSTILGRHGSLGLLAMAACGRVFDFPGNSGYVWSQFVENRKVFPGGECIYRTADFLHHTGNADCLCGLHLFHPVSYELCAQA